MKEWAFNQYIPLDSNIIFHKIVACTALFFSVLHAVSQDKSYIFAFFSIHQYQVGHLCNFYHVSTQPLEHLHCLR